MNGGRLGTGQRHCTAGEESLRHSIEIAELEVWRSEVAKGVACQIPVAPCAKLDRESHPCRRAARFRRD